MTSPFLSQLRQIHDLAGPAGRLEAVLNTGPEDAPYAALVCHPHPPSGGTLHNKVVFHAMKTFTGLGIPVLRFNFRGTGLSAGTHDEGRGEVDDVRAALDWLAQNFAKPILLAGFSFGANVGMRAACGDPRVAGLIGLGLPVRAAGRDYHYHFLPACGQPKLFLSGDHDQFCPRPVMEEVFAGAPDPKSLVWIEGAEHFFQGIPQSPAPKLAGMQAALRAWLIESFGLRG
jgi:alpha/beta superfamily hydrolase